MPDKIVEHTKLHKSHIYIKLILCDNGNIKKVKKSQKVLCNTILLLLIRDRHDAFSSISYEKSGNMTFTSMLASYFNK